MICRASATDARESGTWTAIWSPSKSALKAVQTSGWIWIAEPPLSTGSNAWMPGRCSVGARAAQGRAEAARCGPEHVRGALQLVVAGSRHCAAAAVVVAQPVDGVLEHALFVADDDLRRAQLQQPLEAVVAVDDAAVEVVKV